MYWKKTLTYGNKKAVKKYHTLKDRVKGEKRPNRRKPTGEEMQLANEMRAKKKLYMLIVNNFSLGDWHLTLTYAKENRVGVDKSKELIKKFLRMLRKEYRKAGRELKYIIVTEWESHSLHHHIMINDIPGLSLYLSMLWTVGGAHLTPLYADGNQQGLSDYFVKETAKTFRKESNPYKQRWSCSRNLKKPEEQVEKAKADSWREDPKPTKREEKEGYILVKDSVVSGFDRFGYPYQEYELIRYDRSEKKRKKTVLTGGQR